MTSAPTNHEPQDVLLALSVCPLLALSDTMSGAIGLGIATLLTLLLSRTISIIASRLLADEWLLSAQLIIVAAVASGIAMLTHAYFPAMFQALGIFPLLLATNAVLALRFGQPASALDAIKDSLKLGVQIAVLLIVLGIARELVGRGSVFYDAGNQFGEWARSLQLFRADMGFLLAMLPPGAFISLGLLLAARNWFAARRT